MKYTTIILGLVIILSSCSSSEQKDNSNYLYIESTTIIIPLRIIQAYNYKKHMLTCLAYLAITLIQPLKNTYNFLLAGQSSI